MRHSRRPALLALVGLIAVGCGGGWQQMRTRHFTGYAERPRDYRETMKQLEYAYAALSAFFPRVEVGKVEVLFVPGASRIHDFGIDRGGLVLPWVPQSGRLGRQNLVVMSEADGNVTSLALLTHLFVNKAIPAAPLWLHHALSAYFTQTSIQAGQGRWVACFGHHIAVEARLFQMPLDRFFTVKWNEYPTAGPGFVRGTGRLLMDYIFHADQGAHLQKLPAIFAAVGQGASGPEVMSATFPGVSLEELGKRISDFKGSQIEQRARGQLCPLPVPIAPGKIPDESDPEESPIAAQEIDQLMAALRKLPHGTALPAWYPPDMLGPAP